MTKQKCGFVAIVGVPNAGKSTLLNACVGQDLSIVTSKVQTTRAQLKGIAIEDESQIIFIDTPGIFQSAKRNLEKKMVQAAWDSLEEADAILVVIDVSKKLDADTQMILTTLKERGRNAVLVMNKIDQVKEKEKLLPMTAQLNELGQFSDTFMVSAKTGRGVADLLKFLAEKMPEGPWLYPEDQLTDMTERFIAAEITREKLFKKLRQELPYNLTVETDGWTVKKKGDVEILQTIFVQKPGQKAIILGEKGQMISEIGRTARLAISERLGIKAHLKLFVKVRKDWVEKAERLKALGLHN